MKAVKITLDNQSYLAERYCVSEDDKSELLPLGYYLVTDFGINHGKDYSTLTEMQLDELFDRGAETKNNDFFEITEK